MRIGICSLATLVIWTSLLPAQKTQRAAYHHYDNIEAYLIQDPDGTWRARDFAGIALNPNPDKPIKVVFKFTSNDPQYLFCPEGSDRCRPGPIYRYGILEAFSDTARWIVFGINTPGLVFPPPSHERPYQFTGMVEVYSCEDLDPNSYCDPPTTVQDERQRPSFYSQDVANFLSPEGRGARPEAAFKDSWQRYDQYVDVYWDPQLKRYLVPFANLYNNLSDWPFGWQTDVRIMNRSRQDIRCVLSNHLWYGWHTHGSDCDSPCSSETVLSGSFLIRAGRLSEVDPFREMSLTQDSRRQTDSIVLSERYWEHDSALSMQFCGEDSQSHGDCIQVPPDQVEIQVRVRPNTTNNLACFKTADLIRQLYRDFLEREPDDAEVHDWTYRIESRKITRVEAALQFLNSGEFQGVLAPVARLYLGFMGRRPSLEDLKHLAQDCSAEECRQAALHDLAETLTRTREFRARFNSTLPLRSYIRHMYRTMLGRPPLKEELQSCIAKWKAGRSRGELIGELAQSEEFAKRSGGDVFETLVYAGFLRRDADDRSFGISTTAGKTERDLVGEILASLEYRRRFKETPAAEIAVAP